MVFNSYTFVIFFLLVVALHRMPLPWRRKKLNLLLASYLFYAAWNPPFVFLLWLSTVVDWFIAKALYSSQNQPYRRLMLGLSLGTNLGLLGFFKYSGFLLENLITLLDTIGVQYHPAAPNIILPVGISFYTFQTLSYTLDVYRRQARPWDSFLDYALYVTFFPQLVAGPIVRATDFLPQCRQPHNATHAQLNWGLSLLVLGLFQKIVLADGLLAPVVEGLYDQAGSPDLISAWAGTLAFAGQIFCDFAGYSTCAIGVAMCLGFALPDNFRFPYAAVGFSDFWRRWHISLSTWLRDYLYIPLGGNRKTRLRTDMNLMVTMLLGGLWHGASWTFVAWGGLHGTYLVAEKVCRARYGQMPLWRRPFVQFLLGLLTFGLICLTWVFFRAHSFEQAWSIVSAMLGIFPEVPSFRLSLIHVATAVLVTTGIVGAHWFMRHRSLEAVAESSPWWVHSVVLTAMICAIVMMPGEDRAFIYFQF